MSAREERNAVSAVQSLRRALARAVEEGLVKGDGDIGLLGPSIRGELRSARTLVSGELIVSLSCPIGRRGASRVPPLVGVLGGSTTDFPILERTVAVLAQLRVPSELLVVSAHRTPDRLFRYAEEAATRGIEVIVAGAGGAAHLPGMLAAKTHLPVIGVPIPTKNLWGLDSLLSIVQMPRGVPVATVAIDGAENAGLLAAQILAGRYQMIRDRVVQFRAELTRAAIASSPEAKRRRR